MMTKEERKVYNKQYHLNRMKRMAEDPVFELQVRTKSRAAFRKWYQSNKDKFQVMNNICRRKRNARLKLEKLNQSN